MRPPYQPSEKDQRIVEAMAAGGIRQEEICRAIGVSAKTLRKYFREVLNRSASRANAQVISTMFRMATSGEHAAATIFWCKTRMGWKEPRAEDTSKSPMEVIVRSVLDPKPG